MGKSKKQGLGEDGWNALVQCFRDEKTVSEAARELGIDRKTAKKALEVGYPPGRAFPAGKPPIETVLESDRALARADTETALFSQKAEEEGTLAERLLVAVNNAASSVIRSHGDSGTRIHLAGKSTQAALASAARLQVVGDKLAKRLVKKIEILADPAQTRLEDLDIKSNMVFLREIAKFSRDAAETMRIVDDMERRHLGTPEDIRSLIVDISKTENIPEEEAEHIMQVGMQMLGYDDPSEHVDLDAEDPDVVEAEFEELEKGLIEEDEREEDDTEETLEEEEELAEDEGPEEETADVQDA